MKSLKTSTSFLDLVAHKWAFNQMANKFFGQDVLKASRNDERLISIIAG